jgi:hypothetical protein
LCADLDLDRKTALDLARGGTAPLGKLIRAAADMKARMAAAGGRAAEGMPFWGEPLLAAESVRKQQKRLTAAMAFLEALAPAQGIADSEALRAFLDNPADLGKVSTGKAVLEEIEKLHDRIHRLCDLTGYLTAAEALLPWGHPWSQASLEARDLVRREMADPRQRGRIGFIETMRRSLAERRDAFIDLYLAAHDGADRNVHPAPCRSLRREDLRHSPLCPHCRFKPWERRTAPEW